MAAADQLTKSQGRHLRSQKRVTSLLPLLILSEERLSRIRPFAWMRRLAHRRTPEKMRPTTKQSNKMNFPELRKSKQAAELHQTPPTITTDIERIAQDHRPIDSLGSEQEAGGVRSFGENRRSMAPTITTNPETIPSEGDRQSKAGTSVTMNGALSSISGGGNSIFSSPNHSARSLTTTLTTIQSQGTSTAPGSYLPMVHPYYQSSTYFSHQYPTAPVLALPTHLNPHQSHLPTTYRLSLIHI